MAKKRVRFLISVATARGDFHGDREYALPAGQADGFVREGVAVYVGPTAGGTGAEGRRGTKGHGGGGRGGTGWRDTMGPGDIFDWQVRPRLPLLAGLYIRPGCKEPWRRTLRGGGARGRRAYLAEVGGYGGGASPAEAAAIDYLVRNEGAVRATVLRAVADYAGRLRAGGGWEAFDDPPGIDAVLPRGMTPEQVAERVRVTHVGVPERARDGIGYLEVSGECAWDPDHGFVVVLHRDRVVGVYQQGTGWVDRGPVRRGPRAAKRGGKAAPRAKRSRR